MTLEELVQSKLIDPKEYKIYRIFELSEDGKSWYNDMLMDTFMDCVPPPMFSSLIFAYADGRRSTFRDIKITIDKINQLIEGNYGK